MGGMRVGCICGIGGKSSTVSAPGPSGQWPVAAEAEYTRPLKLVRYLMPVTTPHPHPCVAFSRLRPPSPHTSSAIRLLTLHFCCSIRCTSPHHHRDRYCIPRVPGHLSPPCSGYHGSRPGPIYPGPNVATDVPEIIDERNVMVQWRAQASAQGRRGPGGQCRRLQSGTVSARLRRVVERRRRVTLRPAVSSVRMN